MVGLTAVQSGAVKACVARFSRILLGLGIALAAVRAPAVLPTTDELATASSWVTASFTSQTPSLPFSFTYNGWSSSSLLSSWASSKTTTNLDTKRVQHTLIYTDLTTGLVVRCVAIQYLDFPTVEWTVYFKNIGTQDTPVLENIQAADFSVNRVAGSEFVLHHNLGSMRSAQEYQPIDSSLPPLASIRLAPEGGRPSSTVLPYIECRVGTGNRICNRRYSCNRMAGSVGGSVHPRLRQQPANPCWSGADAFQAASWGRGKEPACCTAVLARGPQPLSKRLAAVDDRS